jgi:CheY-like chemotaxis protein
VVARSEGLGKGSEFILRLPLASDLRPAVDAKSRPVAEPALSGDKRSVVLVEDSDDFRDVLQEMLEDLGHEVSVAKDGLAGAALIQKLRPDVALVDLGLPGIDGFEVARRIRAAADGASLYLVALTGYGGADDALRAQSAGFDRHLIKPTSVEELTRVVSFQKSARAF